MLNSSKRATTEATLRGLDFIASPDFSDSSFRVSLGPVQLFCSECKTETPHLIFVDDDSTKLFSERRPRAFCGALVSKGYIERSIYRPASKLQVEREKIAPCGNFNAVHLRVVVVARRLIEEEKTRKALRTQKLRREYP